MGWEDNDGKERGREGRGGESVMLPNYTESIILKRWRHLKHINSVKCVHVTKCGQRMNSLSQHQWHGSLSAFAWAIWSLWTTHVCLA